MRKELFDKAVSFHGHSCPGVAIGVRAAIEAKRILEIDDIQSKGLYCVVEQMACYTDGIQVLLGCTSGKGNLIYRPTGKCAFSFFNTDNGKSVRLYKLDMDAGMDRAAAIDFILNAPLEQVFAVSEPTVSAPKYTPRSKSYPCAVCGEKVTENYLRVKNGKFLCLECAGLL